MKRSPMPPRRAPMNRTGILRTAGVQLSRRRPKMTPIRKSAKGENCTLRFYVCRNRTDTTVWAHSNRLVDGKGAGLKASDENGCYSCFECHTYLDHGWASDRDVTFDDVQAVFERAKAESQEILRRKGLMGEEG